MDCPSCNGVGTKPGEPWVSCPTCDRIGKTWIPGAPGFGCKMKLGSRKVGEIVTLGNGDRGRILRHNKHGTPTTSLGLIGEFDDRESHTPTSYPSVTGVASVADPRFFTDDEDHAKSHEDVVDPMRRNHQ
jgi:hypothetical protein